MNTSRIIAALLLIFLAAARASAAPIYTTTDLGTDPRVETNASGQAYGVRNLDTGVVYDFAKLPVTPINVITGTPDTPNQFYTELTMQSGAHQVGDRYVINGSTGDRYYVPSFEGALAGWFSYSSPVSDINRQGQVVGTSLYYNTGQTYAAFSDVNVATHVVSGSTLSEEVNNLNNYIATIPGMSLTSAFAIDDVGRILATGSDGHDYLLTPVSLGAPATVPEPSTAIVFGVIGSFLGLQTVRRRNRRVRNS